MISQALQAKIDKSVKLIQRAEATAIRYRDKGFFVAFSGGKDSQVLLPSYSTHIGEPFPTNSTLIGEPFQSNSTHIRGHIATILILS